jgi:HD-like signal output (HDOD) protein
MERIQDRYDDPDLEEAEIARLMGQDPEMQALVQKMRDD